MLIDSIWNNRYQEILTDPSYAGQFVLMTCPHIGNTGVNSGILSRFPYISLIMYYIWLCISKC